MEMRSDLEGKALQGSVGGGKRHRWKSKYSGPKARTFLSSNNSSEHRSSRKVGHEAVQWGRHLILWSFDAHWETDFSSNCNARRGLRWGDNMIWSSLLKDNAGCFMKSSYQVQCERSGLGGSDGGGSWMGNFQGLFQDRINRSYCRMG